ncbi:craniofacial development protein 2-like [Colias croceus]|uniref:craniofacial development protein 2-like n=1 Tax=Colias crocea TaxID=72248 RepID=UPI001E27F582|nr:craniofacial development protein 2-like [Colias croceus]
MFSFLTAVLLTDYYLYIDVRREGEDTVTLTSGNLFFYREGDQKAQGGIGFIVRRPLINNILAIESVSSRVAYLILKISDRYSLKVIQVYAPTSTHSDEDVEVMYEDISRAIHTSKTHFNVVMGDFNAKLGKRGDDELRVGQFGFGQRNPRGQRLAEFLEREGLFMMNSFFQKSPHRKWTWISPDGKTRNEIDFIMTTKRHIFNDVSVINRVKTGSDHRMVRGTLNIDVKLERSRLMKSTLRPFRTQIQNPESFQLELQNRFACLGDDVSVDDLNNRLIETIRTVGLHHCKIPRKNQSQKLSDHTLKLLAERRSLLLNTSDDAKSYRQLNRRITKSLRHDIRSFNTKNIEEAIQRNKGSKVFARDGSIGQSRLTKLKTESGKIVSSQPELIGEVLEPD